MGFAEMLIHLDISYDSREAVDLAARLMKFIQDAAVRASRELATERGAFANWPGSVREQRGSRLRNATLTAIAPTGTIGIVADTTPSIEPFGVHALARSDLAD